MALNSSVFVTGAAGQIGGQIAQSLRDLGNHVITTDLHGPVDVHVDLTSYDQVLEAMRGCTHVIHCGAIPTTIDGREHDVLASNAQGTWNVLQSCVNLGIKRVVAFSSVNGLGSFAGRRPLAYLPGDDAYPVQTENAYQLAKHLVETVAHHYARVHGLDIALLRPVFVATDKAYSHWTVTGNRVASIWNISDLWSYVDLRDVVRAALLATTADFTGCHALLLAANDTNTTLTTADLLEQFYPEATMTERLRDWLSSGDPYQGLIDCSAAKNVIGWAPQHSWRNS
jgi:nucleoside-diphosphate-sugar epimerase